MLPKSQMKLSFLTNKSNNATQASTNSSNEFEGSRICFQDANDEEPAIDSSNLDDLIVAVDTATKDLSIGELDVFFVDYDNNDDKIVMITWRLHWGY